MLVTWRLLSSTAGGLRVAVGRAALPRPQHSKRPVQSPASQPAMQDSLQQSKGHLSLYLAVVNRLAHFCAWLPAHAGLVAHIDLSPLLLLSTDQQEACQLLLFALQACATQQGLAKANAALAAATAPLAAATGGHDDTAGPQHESQHQQQRQQPVALQLCSYTSNCLTSAAVLEALNQQCATCLSTLRLRRLDPAQIKQCWCTALAALPGLRQLSVDLLYPQDPDNTRGTLPSSFTSALAQLQHLTQLHVGGFIQPEHLQQLPTSLQRLTLEYDQEQAAHATVPVQLAHLLK